MYETQILHRRFEYGWILNYVRNSDGPGINMTLIYPIVPNSGDQLGLPVMVKSATIRELGSLIHTMENAKIVEFDGKLFFEQFSANTEDFYFCKVELYSKINVIELSNGFVVKGSSRLIDHSDITQLFNYSK